MSRFPQLPPETPKVRSAWRRAVGTTGLWLAGWRIEGNLPNLRKFVLVVAPHTSNWDFVVGFLVYLALQIEHGTNALDDVLCMFRLGGWPMEDLLEQVAAFPDDVLAHRFWRDWCEHHVPGREAVWITPFWEAPDNTAAYDFYTSPEIHARMEALALADATDPELAAQASAVVGVIEAGADWLR